MSDLSPRAMPARVVWTVAGLLQAVGDAINARLPACTVTGELSALSRPASGHLYFSLKDADGHAALLRCAMFRRSASLLDFAPAEGQRVELRGRIALYEPRGELQVIVESMQRAGAGSLYEQFLRLKARLEAEGLFDPARRRPIPAHPRTIGVVTSLGAAALHDVCTALARRAPHVRVLIYPSLVQGVEAPAALVAALAAASVRREVDLVLLCRGGGSLEDLWAFNDERVVRAVAGSPIPVICGVGHETDVTLADLAADLRAPTPTAAAELAAPSRADLLQALDRRALQLRQGVQRRLDREGQRLDAAALRLARPRAAVSAQQRTLDRLAVRLREAREAALRRRQLEIERLGHRLVAASRRLQAQQGQRLALAGSRLQLLDPQRVLDRGFSMLVDARGRAVTQVAQASPGTRLHAHLADGHVAVQVLPAVVG